MIIIYILFGNVCWVDSFVCFLGVVVFVFEVVNFDVFFVKILFDLLCNICNGYF